MDLFQVRLQVTEMCDSVADTFSEDLRTLIKNETFLTGGVFKSLVLDETVNDWDFYFKSDEAILKFLNLLTKETHTQSSPLTNRDKINFSKIRITTDNAVTFKLPKATIQFITFKAGRPKDIIGEFDFAHTLCYYDSLTADFVCPTHLIVGKQLRYNEKAYAPLSAMKRAFKFVKQGWNLPDNELEKITKSIVGVDWKDPEEVKKQTRGLYRQPPVEEPLTARGTDPVPTGINQMGRALDDQPDTARAYDTTEDMPTTRNF